jgi:3-deoxy-manno-octulosonate cytidylyltransferase (CMP-KDO synthetase)
MAVLYIMNIVKNPIILIPSRLASSRFPNKPLADIHGEPMIVTCWRRAKEADIGPVIVACGDEEIKLAVEAVGGHAIMTDPNHMSGSDRIHEAITLIDPDLRHDCVINFQGDLPTIDSKIIVSVLGPMVNHSVDIATLISKISNPEECNNPNIVKVAVGLKEGEKLGRALYFSRANIPAGNGPRYHHIGLYAYRRKALDQFIRWPRGILEDYENLEQLRVLENGLQIGVALVDTVPLGVDTLEDLILARKILKTIS